jgi:HKD family nuclease
MRRNVMGWLSEQVPSARHALILTHNIDFLFVQSVLLPQLRQAGNPKLTIFADSMCALQTFDQQRPLLDGLGVRYRVVQVDMGAGRRFHPKALLLAGPERAALAIGSGNLTHGGMGANHEAWAFAVSDGEGAALIAAFRDYATTLATTLPLPEALEDGMDAIFDPSHAWAAALPAPAGLARSPSPIPVLDQIAAMITGDVRSVSVLAPYHDDNAVALSAIAVKYNVPVTCWVQPGRAGLSQTAASTLPTNVSLKSIDCVEERRPSFIHAKVLSFARGDDVVMAIGSANCSQAALLADSTWGNAELVAVDALSAERANEFFEELVRSDAAPPLPAHPPSEDWEEVASQPLRILAARQEGEALRVAFHSRSALTDIRLETPEGVWPTTSTSAARATFSPTHRVRLVAISGVTETGVRLTSPQTWVDDESSLAAPATLRRVFRRFQEGDSDADPAQTYRGVVELFGDYLRDPEAARRRVYRSNDEARSTGPYDPSVVFSDDFGIGSFSAYGARIDAHAPTNILAIIEGMFSVGRSATNPKAATPPPVPNAPEEEGIDPAVAEAALLRWKRTDATTNVRMSAALRRAVIAVERALCDSAFVEGRSPALLGADVAVAAVLLVKGLADGHLDVATYRESTRRIWQALFFGSGGALGALPARIESIAENERAGFIAALTSPRLSAAIALWSITEFGAEDADAIWFRYSAAALQEQCPGGFNRSRQRLWRR